ncbi:MAG: murein transglycosylase [Legionella sp. 40-6]|nr:MAG: murein transglycosylase [Legionella sp. 40-6]
MLRTAIIVGCLLLSLAAQAVLPNDAIQRCLDVRRLADFTTRQKMAAKEPGVLRFKFHKIPASALPLNNTVMNMTEVITALEHQMDHCTKKSGSVNKIVIAGKTFKRHQWCLQMNQKMLAYAKAAKGDFKKYLARIQNEFDWYQSDGWPENQIGLNKGTFQFTAYYAPAAIEASSQRNQKFVYPIYSNPGVVNVAFEAQKLRLKTPLCGVDPLTKMMRGYCMKNANGSYSIAPDREEIERGVLDPKYIIGYVRDPNDPHFLMLEGSGSLILDGRLFHLNYDGYNGRPRTMLGRIVQCSQDPTCGGNLDTMERCAQDPKCHDLEKLRCKVSKEIRQSAAAEKFIRHYLDNHKNASDLRNRDQSYVFFARENGGPYGSENIPLTPHTSCATDHKVIPLGISMLYNFKNTTSWCIAQDTGGAIVGAHIDIYKGEGDEAGIEANAVNDSGALFIALPKREHKRV